MKHENNSVYLFVYGTLMKCLNQPVHAIMLKGAKYLCRAKTQGRLYNIGEYPGMVKNTTDAWVYGELYLLKQQESTFAKLDEYEEVGTAFPEPNEYFRDIFEVYPENGQAIQAWIYIYKLPTHKLQVIESGDYKAFVGKD